jgi:hypothetical protein
VGMRNNPPHLKSFGMRAGRHIFLSKLPIIIAAYCIPHMIPQLANALIRTVLGECASF